MEQEQEKTYVFRVKGYGSYMLWNDTSMKSVKERAKEYSWQYCGCIVSVYEAGKSRCMYRCINGKTIKKTED